MNNDSFPEHTISIAKVALQRERDVLDGGVKGDELLRVRNPLNK